MLRVDNLFKILNQLQVSATLDLKSKLSASYSPSTGIMELKVDKKADVSFSDNLSLFISFTHLANLSISHLKWIIFFVSMIPYQRKNKADLWTQIFLIKHRKYFFFRFYDSNINLSIKSSLPVNRALNKASISRFKPNQPIFQLWNNEFWEKGLKRFPTLLIFCSPVCVLVASAYSTLNIWIFEYWILIILNIEYNLILNLNIEFKYWILNIEFN